MQAYRADLRSYLMTNVGSHCLVNDLLLEGIFDESLALMLRSFDLTREHFEEVTVRHDHFSIVAKLEQDPLEHLHFLVVVLSAYHWLSYRESKVVERGEIFSILFVIFLLDPVLLLVTLVLLEIVGLARARIVLLTRILTSRPILSLSFRIVVDFLFWFGMKLSMVATFII